MRRASRYRPYVGRSDPTWLGDPVWIAHCNQHPADTVWRLTQSEAFRAAVAHAALHHPKETP